ncbi:hypothetical protein PAPHI01_0597 [Pancytospora philotis]|nr:hypothetical protein PAPHI01_0597 [Pancytospora philotis]
MHVRALDTIDSFSPVHSRLLCKILILSADGNCRRLMVKEGIKSEVVIAQQKCAKGSSTGFMAHMCASALLYRQMDMRHAGAGAAAALSYAFILNMFVVLEMALVLPLFYGVPFEPLQILLAVFVYAALYLTYCVISSRVLRLCAIPLSCTQTLAVCVCSLTHLPLMLIAAEIRFVPSEYMVAALVAYSSSFVAKNTIHRRACASLFANCVHTLFIVVTQYAMVHFYKGTLYYAPAHAAALISMLQ